MHFLFKIILFLESVVVVLQQVVVYKIITVVKLVLNYSNVNYVIKSSLANIHSIIICYVILGKLNTLVHGVTKCSDIQDISRFDYFIIIIIVIVSLNRSAVVGWLLVVYTT